MHSIPDATMNDLRDHQSRLAENFSRTSFETRHDQHPATTCFVFRTTWRRIGVAKRLRLRLLSLFGYFCLSTYTNLNNYSKTKPYLWTKFLAHSNLLLEIHWDLHPNVRKYVIESQFQQKAPFSLQSLTQ